MSTIKPATPIMDSGSSFTIRGKTVLQCHLSTAHYLIGIRKETPISVKFTVSAMLHKRNDDTLHTCAKWFYANRTETLSPTRKIAFPAKIHCEFWRLKRNLLNILPKMHKTIGWMVGNLQKKQNFPIAGKAERLKSNRFNGLTKFNILTAEQFL